MSTTQRFVGPEASARSLHVSAAAILVVIGACGIVGLVTSIQVLTFFAVGAGAGYSLSGSV